jgi:hypothetical protein
MRTLTVEIPGRPPTPNARPGNKWELARWVEKWVEIARLAAQDAMASSSWPLTLDRPGIPAEGRRRKPVPALLRCTDPIPYVSDYTMIFIVEDRAERDWDNAVASSKPLTDGLVRAGVIAGDSTRFIRSAGRVVDFRYVRGVNGVEITIQEGEAPAAQLTLGVNP